MIENGNTVDVSENKESQIKDIQELLKKINELIESKHLDNIGAVIDNTGALVLSDASTEEELTFDKDCELNAIYEFVNFLLSSPSSETTTENANFALHPIEALKDTFGGKGRKTENAKVLYYMSIVTGLTNAKLKELINTIPKLVEGYKFKLNKDKDGNNILDACKKIWENVKGANKIIKNINKLWRENKYNTAATKQIAEMANMEDTLLSTLKQAHQEKANSNNQKSNENKKKRDILDLDIDKMTPEQRREYLKTESFSEQDDDNYIDEESIDKYNKEDSTYKTLSKYFTLIKADIESLVGTKDTTGSVEDAFKNVEAYKETLPRQFDKMKAAYDKLYDKDNGYIANISNIINTEIFANDRITTVKNLYDKATEANEKIKKALLKKQNEARADKIQALDEAKNALNAFKKTSWPTEVIAYAAEFLKDTSKKPNKLIESLRDYNIKDNKIKELLIHLKDSKKSSEFNLDNDNDEPKNENMSEKDILKEYNKAKAKLLNFDLTKVNDEDGNGIVLEDKYGSQYDPNTGKRIWTSKNGHENITEDDIEKATAENDEKAEDETDDESNDDFSLDDEGNGDDFSLDDDDDSASNDSDDDFSLDDKESEEGEEEEEGGDDDFSLDDDSDEGDDFSLDDEDDDESDDFSLDADEENDFDLGDDEDEVEEDEEEESDNSSEDTKEVAKMAMDKLSNLSNQLIDLLKTK